MAKNRKRAFFMNRQQFHKGVYILPNLFTALNLFLGFLVVILSMDGKFYLAAALIVLAGLCDGLDGKVARATHTTSKFGVEFDSLADLISFGMAPALMFYLWVLKDMGRLGWLAGFLFTICGALRLARFNTQTGTVSSEFFVGLPIPAAAGMVAATTLFFEEFGLKESVPAVVFLLLMFGLSFLMVSTVRYHSFKKPELFRRMNFNALVGAILIFIFIAYQHEIALFLISLVYVGSGPLLRLLHRKPLAADILVKPDEEHPHVV